MTNLQQSFREYVKQKNQEKEEITLYNKNRKKLRIDYRNSQQNKEEWKKCVLCFVVDKEGNVIIEHKNNDEKDGCSGHIQSYEVATQAVIRELYEELSIDIEEALQVIHLGNVVINSEETKEELQCFLEVYCLFRDRDTILEYNEKEIKKLEKVPGREFLEQLLNNEIFPCVEAYLPIIMKFVRLYQERFGRKIVLQRERD